jgi:hypothetical protein
MSRTMKLEASNEVKAGKDFCELFYNKSWNFRWN